MLKMIAIATVVFVMTVGTGVGLGFMYLSWSKNTQTQTPLPPIIVPSPIPSPTPSPTPSASPSASLNKSTIKLLVVNSTTKAGYAGQIRTKLNSAQFTNVKAANAKGEYQTGNYLLLVSPDPTLSSELEAATSLTLTYLDKKNVEDPQNQYQAIIVLAE